MVDNLEFVVGLLRRTGNEGKNSVFTPYDSIRLADEIEKLSYAAKMAALPLNKGLEADVRRLRTELEQVTRERDAAIAYLMQGECETCRHEQHDTKLCKQAGFICGDCKADCLCRQCRNNDKWDWYGVPQEEVKA